MKYPDSFSHKMPPESQSRQLDQFVAAQEMPYGYDYPPPPADTGDYDMKSRESKKEYKTRDRRG